MDTMEINKIVGACVGALLIYLGVQFFAELVFHPASHGDEHEYAYALEVQETGGGEEEQIDVAALLEGGDAGRGERIFGKCKACHKVDGSNGTGPHLDGVVNREIDAVAGFSYSGALEQVGDVWSKENLFHFLENPKAVAPGTAMGFAGLRKPDDRADLIAYLATLQ
ncbi:cytochrome c family protein [uncultured Albimonas sp.]|uniref:c-type cytochrome n=1 Tax=uncultured Albimonas sp. TaxID=1331701 RepID=UPI0030EEC977|tara:strand:+ start:1114 stop:1614 length:501 start_codon:yes stop_codon:yes gene_type:complete